MSHLSNAAEAMAAVARTITDDQLANKTPCMEYDVRALVNHLLFWRPSLAGAGRKESVPQPAAAESDVDLAAGDWRGRLLALLDDITSSWAPPSAWEGETSMGTPQTLPAPVMGDMIVGELAVHGWDLAVATGSGWNCPPTCSRICTTRCSPAWSRGGRWACTDRRSRCRPTHPPWTASSA